MSAHRQILVPTPDFICRHRELRIVLAPPEGVDADVAHQRPEEGGPLLEPLAAVGDDGRGHAVSRVAGRRVHGAGKPRWRVQWAVM